jgi:hypothetical protein
MATAPSASNCWDRAEADRYTLCKILYIQVIFTGLFNMYPETYKKMRDSLQPSTKDGTGKSFTSRTKQMSKVRHNL